MRTPHTDSTVSRALQSAFATYIMRRERPRSPLALATRRREPYCLHCGDHGYLWIRGDDDEPCPWCNAQVGKVTT